MIDYTKYEKILKSHARGLGLPSGSANEFIRRALKAAEKSLKGRKITTDADIIRAMTKELTKYNSDLAYVFENYDKII